MHDCADHEKQWRPSFTMADSKVWQSMEQRQRYALVGIPVVSGSLLGSRGNRCSSWWLPSSANGRYGAPMLESSVDLIESLAPTY